MPIYEYECPECGHHFETLVIGRCEKSPECPKCGKKEVTRRPSVLSPLGSGKSDSCATGRKGFS